MLYSQMLIVCKPTISFLDAYDKEMAVSVHRDVDVNIHNSFVNNGEK